MATLDKHTARYERRAILNKVRRDIKKSVGNGAVIALQGIEGWILERQARYDKKPGGL